MDGVPEFFIALLNPNENANYIQALSASYEFSQSEEGLEWSLSYIQYIKQKKFQLSPEENNISIFAFSTMKNFILNNYSDIHTEIKENIKEILFNHQESDSLSDQFHSFFSSAQSTFVICSLINDWPSFFTEFLSPAVITTSFALKERKCFLLDFLVQIQKDDNYEIIQFLEESEQENLILDFVLNALDYSDNDSLKILNLCLSFMHESLLSDEAIILKISEAISERKYLIQAFDCINTILFRNVNEETKGQIASSLATPEIIQEILESISQEEENGEVSKINLNTESSYDNESFLFTLTMTISALSSLSLESYTDIIIDIFSNGFLTSIEILSPKVEQIITNVINESKENENEQQENLSHFIEPTFLALCKYYEDDEFFSDDFQKSILTIMNKIFYHGKNISLLITYFTEVLQNVDPNDDSLLIFITSTTDFISDFMSFNESKSLLNNDIAASFFPIISEFFFIFDERPPFQSPLIPRIMKDITYYFTYLNGFDFSPFIQPIIEIISSGYDCISSNFCKIIENNAKNIQFYESFIADAISSGNEYLIRSASAAITLNQAAFDQTIFHQCFHQLYSQLDFENCLSHNEFDTDFHNNLRYILSFIDEVSPSNSQQFFQPMSEELNSFFQQIFNIEFSETNLQNRPLLNDQIRSLFVHSYFNCYKDSHFEIIWKLFTESLDQPLTISTFLAIFKQIIQTNEQITREFPVIFDLCEETFSRNSSLIIDIGDEIVNCLAMIQSLIDFVLENKSIIASFDEELQSRFLSFYESIIKTEYQDLDLFRKIINSFSIFIQENLITLPPELFQSISFYSWNFYCNINFTIEENQELINSIIHFHSLLLIADETISQICNEQIAQGLLEIGVELNISEYIQLLGAFSQEQSQENYDNLILFFKSIYEQRLKYTLKEEQKYAFL